MHDVGGFVNSQRVEMALRGTGLGAGERACSRTIAAQRALRVLGAPTLAIVKQTS